MLNKLFGFSHDRRSLNWPKASDVGCKNVQMLKTVQMPTPKQVRIRMDQHAEFACTPLVKRGDEVKMGQVIATCELVPTVLIHASVSGKVMKIEEVLLENGTKTKEVIIESDEIQSTEPTVAPPAIHDTHGFLDAVEKSGINELSAGDFLQAAREGRKYSTLFINATTCEPFVATPSREILEQPMALLDTITVLMKHLNIDAGIIGIEGKQVENVTAIQNILMTRKGYTHLSLKPLASSYAGAADKDDVLVLNVTTIGDLLRYLETGLPVVNTRITVNGSAVAAPKNVFVPIGTQVKDVIDFCGGYKEMPQKIFLGGPLTGTACLNDEATVSKRTTAVFAFGAREAAVDEEAECIRCGRCVEVCPVNLMPVSIDQAVRANQLEALEELNVTACTGCGRCSFICPSNRHLVQTIQLAKSRIESHSILKDEDKELSV